MHQTVAGDNDAVIVSYRTVHGSGLSVVAAYDLDGGDLSDVLRGLRHLTETQARAALAYYQEHRERVEANVAHHQRALGELRKASVGIAG